MKPGTQEYRRAVEESINKHGCMIPFSVACAYTGYTRPGLVRAIKADGRWAEVVEYPTHAGGTVRCVSIRLCRSYARDLPE